MLRFSSSSSNKALFLTSLPLLALVLAACATESAESTANIAGADRIQSFDDPSGLLGTMSRKLVDNVSAADIGQTFGVDDAFVPYPDTYWPMVDNGIDARWHDAGEASPLEKLVGMTNPANLSKSKEWNRKNQGVDVPGVQDWFGICHGWTGASITEHPVVRPVSAKLQGNRVVTCEAGSEGCTKFEIGDINALLAQIYSDGNSKFVGARCDTSPANVEKDAFGRIVRRDNAQELGAGCKGVNPGSLLMIMNQRLRNDKKPMAINAQNDGNTDQIWNQPAYRYTVNRFEALSESEAANLVASGARTGTQSHYAWNDDARGFVFLDVTLSWVSENGPNVTYVSGLQSTRTTRMTAVIELDRAATDAQAAIIGGEYVADAVARTSRLKVQPFVWISTGPGRDGSTGHNPYVKTSFVKQLAAFGQD